MCWLGQCTVESVRRWLSKTYNILIRNSHLQSVQLGARYCSQLGFCLICWVLVMLSNLGYEQTLILGVTRKQIFFALLVMRWFKTFEDLNTTKQLYIFHVWHILEYCQWVSGLLHTLSISIWKLNRRVVSYADRLRLLNLSSLMARRTGYGVLLITPRKIENKKNRDRFVSVTEFCLFTCRCRF